MSSLPPVAVFDAELPTGLAVIRSLARAGVEVHAYSAVPEAMGQHSRYISSFTVCPSDEASDEFVRWLVPELETGRIGLIAPTSDLIVFHTMSALAALDRELDVGHPARSNVLDCLLKHRFASALDRIGFPTPATAAPTSVEEACDFGDKVGYPLVAKPRTHIGVGTYRGEVFADESQLRAGFRKFSIGDGHMTALAHDNDLTWPLLQEYIDVPDLEVISLSGYVDPDGEMRALGHSTKQRLWPPKLGIGTLFLSEAPQPFTDQAARAVSSVLGTGIFEFEVLFDRATGDYWGIDLNPRAFGQITLDIARGHDLPRLWYESVTGASLPAARERSSKPSRWQCAIPLTTDLLVGAVRGPDRVESARELARSLGPSTVGAVADWRDPKPSLAFSRAFLRHPGGLVRPFLDR